MPGRREAGHVRADLGEDHLGGALIDTGDRVEQLVVESAKAAGRTKGTYLGAQYHRLRGRRGSGKATIAVAHSILVSAFHMLTDGVPYADLGDRYFDRRQAEHAERHRGVYQPRS